MLGALNQTGVLEPFQGAIAGVEGALDAVAGKGKTVGTVMLGVGAGVTAAGTALALVASKEKESQQQLQAAVQATGHDYEDYAGQVEAAVKHQERFGDTAGETNNALRILTQGMGDPEKALHALGTASELAAAKHESLDTAATQLVKTYNGAGRLLKEFGLQTVPSLTKATTDLQTATQKAASADQAATSAREALSGAQRSARDADRSVIDAQQKLLDISQKLYDIQHNAGAYARDREHGELAVAHAQLGTKESANNLVKAQQDLAAAQKGLDPQKVVDATLALQQAQLGQADAASSLTDAQDNLKQVTDQAVPGTKAYNDLHKQLADAQQGVVDAADNARDAHNKLTDAQNRNADAATKAADAHRGLAKAQDEMARASQGNMAVIDEIGKRLAGQDTAAADTFGGKLREIRATLEDMAAKFGGKWAPAIQTFGIVLLALPSIVTVLSAVFTGLGIAMDLALSPMVVTIGVIGLAIVALIAIGYVLYRNWDTIWGAMKTAVNFVWQILQDVWHWISDNWPLLLAILGGPFGLAVKFIVDHWSGIVDFFSGIVQDIWNVFKDVGKAIASPFVWAWNLIARAWNDTVGKLHFKIPGWVPVLGGNEFGMPTLPTVALQHGGIVTAPTLALLGEAGPEAVVPLGTGVGPAVNIENAVFTGGADLDLLMAKVAFATTAGRL